MKRFKKLMISLFDIQIGRRVVWFEVPMDCVTRKAKDEVILAMIETLERKININNYE
jgi:hypothetical protein